MLVNLREKPWPACCSIKESIRAVEEVGWLYSATMLAGGGRGIKGLGSGREGYLNHLSLPLEFVSGVI